MSVGRDVYLDSNLQIARLEKLSGTAVHAIDDLSVEQKGTKWFISKYAGKVMFRTTCMLLPLDAGFLTNPAWVADRNKLLGGDFPSTVAKRQPSATSELMSTFSFFEDTMLSDGRKWIANTDKPTSVDIEAIWQFIWLDNVQDPLPEQYFSAAKYPNVRAWIERFKHVLREAEQSLAPIEQISGDEAALLIRDSGSVADEELTFDESDPVVTASGLKKGDTVTFWTNDVADQSQKDIGSLVGFDQEKAVIDVSNELTTTIRVHIPRIGFGIEKTTPRV